MSQQVKFNAFPFSCASREPSYHLETDTDFLSRHLIYTKIYPTAICHCSNLTLRAVSKDAHPISLQAVKMPCFPTNVATDHNRVLFSFKPSILWWN